MSEARVGHTTEWGRRAIFSSQVEGLLSGEKRTFIQPALGPGPQGPQGLQRGLMRASPKPGSRWGGDSRAENDGV